ncbi:MAG: glutaredoxin family protein [Candidatus Thiodiazotropha sp. (ex Dulcina madagascariensis)]|nr:glutaredoxin family protein [Candidatus Thiodiazotropha sp. (ex Epidulcina cf. delphinae)]MCU7923663.1 glutaredoxin family protein [Candidatus Thiodiazotropha sp. (ex Dulcina madagascariensis)]MCU7926304.1 glutaredoxin family protein [Candidatus Thiodiazotropha sp. (ex Dulcina madagascariensis)]MCU7935101.1 glutaredoxin family protein [Candidatus Thiodiazotropha sp. (ex Dulcina madagascariensis)]
MLEDLARLRREWEFELIEVDIDQRPEIREKYHARVPVLESAQGLCLSEHFLDQATLLSYLQGA